jgi:hypothetical protein
MCTLALVADSHRQHSDHDTCPTYSVVVTNPRKWMYVDAKDRSKGEIQDEGI